MMSLSPQPNPIAPVPAKTSTPPIDFLSPENSILLQTALESFIDGVLLLSTQKQWIRANRFADQACLQLTQGKPDVVPSEIWQMCQTLLQGYQEFPHQTVILESEVEVSASMTLRVRVRWLHEQAAPDSYFLIILEDVSQSTQNRTITDSMRYGLTPRQAEVWLLRRAGYTYKAIGNELYITGDTVKKHLKDIYAKQRQLLS